MGMVITDLLNQVKQNLILEHDQDNQLIVNLVQSAVAYAEEYQHLPPGYYQLDVSLPEHELSGTTRQAVVMLASHFYESRDGSTGGYWSDNPAAAQAVWDAVNRLLILGRDWKV